MPEPDDHQLLAAYARTDSEPAFAALVIRYVNLVYSTALRSTGNPHHAEEITQAVFIILARKAGRLSPRIVLSGWLYQTARLTSANLVKSEIRRRRREQEVYMQSALNEPTEANWKEIAPLLEDAMGRLGQTDRDALVLRFFENKSAAEIGAAMRMNEDTARRRVNRALEKLRKFFTKCGVTSSAAAIAESISANSVQAAPMALAKSVTAVAIAKGSIAAASTMILVKGTMNMMAWLKLKFAAGVGAMALLTGGAAVLTAGTVARHLWPTPLILSNNGYTWYIGGIVAPSEQTNVTVTVGGTNAIGEFSKWVFNVWQPNLQTLDGLPPRWLLLQPAKTLDHPVPFEMVGKNRYFAKNKSVRELLASIYSRKYPHAKLDFPASLPEGKFDCLVTLQTTNWWEALKSVINKRFNLVERDEHQVGETVVVVKKVN